MVPFLKQVARHYLNCNRKETVFVLPSKRAVEFFRHHTCALSDDAKARVKAVSVNDFFYRIAGARPTDRIRLLLELYAVYCEVKQDPEPLDEFIHWGEVMTGDFDDIDKYLIDARSILVDVADYKALQETLAFLTDEQRAAVEHFLEHFRGMSASLDTDKDGVKARFLSVWNLLAEIYRRYRERLASKGLSYEGLVYRDVAEKLRDGKGDEAQERLEAAYPGVKTFVFAGLNALNECELAVLRWLKGRAMAQFVWDYSTDEIRDGANKSSLFLKKNVREFPGEFIPDTRPGETLSRPSVRAIGVASGVGQAKIGGALATDGTFAADDTVVVLADESLLLPLLRSRNYPDINVTMGYPIGRSAAHALLRSAVTLRVTSRFTPDGMQWFNHAAVEDILSNALVSCTAGEKTRETAARIRKEAKAQVPASDFAGDPMLESIFRQESPAGPEETPAEVNHRTEAWLKEIMGTVYNLLGEDDDAVMEKIFLKHIISVIGSLSGYDLPVTARTHQKLLERLLAGESVPFDGDRMRGLQVMGSLETRALDFRRVIILGANEDRYPGRSTAPSFIPPELRKGFGMPTYEFQDGIWAYYFYRLIQRAEQVTLVYDTRTDGMMSGEESRYIKQLEMLYGFPVEHLTAQGRAVAVADSDEIPKSDEDIRTLKGHHLSASAMQSYLVCPAKFYYQSVKRLRPDEEAAESLDAAALGTVFHAVMETIYTTEDGLMKRAILEGWLGDEPRLRSLIRHLIMETMKTIDVTGRNLVIEEVLTQYARAVLRYDLRRMDEEHTDRIRILGLEKYMETTIEGFRFIGFIDRLDSIRPGEVRVIDYKTGHVENEDIMITESNAAAVCDKLFGESNLGRPKIALQLFLYDRMAAESPLCEGKDVVNGIYSTARLLTRPLPEVPASAPFGELVRERLAQTLREIADTSVAWKRTCDRNACRMCDFRPICGR